LGTFIEKRYTPIPYTIWLEIVLFLFFVMNNMYLRQRTIIKVLD